jgi:hypothetical protein
MTDTSFYGGLPASYAIVDTDDFDEMYADVDDGGGPPTGYGTAARARARTNTATSEEFGGFGSAEYDTATVSGPTLLPAGYEVPASYERIDNDAAAGFPEYDTAAAGADTSSDNGAPAYANVGQPASSAAWAKQQMDGMVYADPTTSAAAWAKQQMDGMVYADPATSAAAWAKQQMDGMVYADPTTSAAAAAAVGDAALPMRTVAPIATRARLRAASASRSGGGAGQSGVVGGGSAPEKGRHVQLGESRAPASSGDEYGWVSVTEDV